MKSLEKYGASDVCFPLMEDLKSLYTDAILDHGRHPRHALELAPRSCEAEGFNPLCGDRLVVQARVIEGTVEAIGFVPDSCLISRASASMMAGFIPGHSLDDAVEKVVAWVACLRGESEEVPEGLSEELQLLLGIQEFPSRIKCVTLSWLTLLAALQKGRESGV